MAEELLRKERGGIIGMFSATRLTYGIGNEHLNRIIFDMLFQRDVRQIGALCFDSKLEYLLTEGTSQLDIMLEYTLFGDPALNIAMADYEILPTIETKTVKTGDTFKIAPGYIQSALYDPTLNKKVFTRNTNFDGELTVKAVFPGEQSIGIDKTGAPKEFYSGDVIVTRTLKVQNGSYPAVEINVPNNISAGDAHVEYYAENDTEIAVGGDGFTVQVPKILDIRPELIKSPSGEDMIDISVLVSDDKKAAVSVVITWRNLQTSANGNVNLVPAETKSSSVSTARWWKLPKPLLAPTDGSPFRYDVEVTDTDGFVVISDYYRYYPFIYPNLSVVSKRDEVDNLIRYNIIDPEDSKQERSLSVDIEVEGRMNAKDAVISETDLISTLGLDEIDVQVAFFSGNPDVDRNGTIDVVCESDRANADRTEGLGGTESTTPKV